MRSSAQLLAASIAVVGLPIVASAGLLFDGSEFQVNTYTTSPQYAYSARSVARVPDGSFVVVWITFAPQDGSGRGVRGQRYASEGAPSGTEFQVNTYTTSNQRHAAVSAAADGSFVVVWDSSGQDGNSGSIQGQRFTSAGAPSGTEFQVNTYTTNGQYFPSVSVAADGSFVVAWHSYGGPDGDYSSIQGQRFTSAGAPSGTEFQVNTYTTNGQYFPSVSAAADGGFVVAWESYGQDGNGSSVHGQRYTSAGAPSGTEFQVNTYATNNQYRPAVSAVADGSFVVAWQSYGQDGDGGSIEGQRFTSTGTPAGTEFQANTFTTNGQYNAAVSAAADGSFVVAWTSDGQDGSTYSVHGQRYTGAGSPSGTEFQVNSYTTGDQYSPSIAVDSAGDFVVVWDSVGQDGSAHGVFSQRLCTDNDSNSVCDTTEYCGPSPAAGCLTGAKASFQLKDSTDDAKDQLKWKFGKGGAFDQAALGDPVASRAYLLCIYDSTSGAPSLVSTLRIDPNAGWTTKDPKGFQYKDKTGAEDGVTKAKLKTGAAGKASASIGAKGINIPMPAPHSVTEIFDQDTTVTVQLVNNQTATCWTSAFTTAKKNDGVQFKATAP